MLLRAAPTLDPHPAEAAWEGAFPLRPAELARLNELIEAPEEDLGALEEEGSPPADGAHPRLAVESIDATLWPLESASSEIPEPRSLAALLSARERAVTRWRHR